MRTRPLHTFNEDNGSSDSYTVPPKCLHRIRTILELTPYGTDNNDLITAYYFTMKPKILTYIGEINLPDSLLWLLHETTVRRYNLTRQESTVQDTIGSTSTTYRLDVLQDYYHILDEWLEQKRDSKRRIRML